MKEIIQFFTDYGDYILIFCCGALLGLGVGLSTKEDKEDEDDV